MPTIVALPSFSSSSGGTIVTGDYELMVDAGGILTLHPIKNMKSLKAAAAPTNPYPVNSCYTSTDNKDPGLIFGGTWERIDNNLQTTTPVYIWRRLK